jgi:hypothetical protein
MEEKRDKNIKIMVFDSGPSFADRYTVVIGKDVYSMSADASSPNGISQYIGTLGIVNDSSGILLKLSDLNIGRKINYERVPEGVKRQIRRILEAEGDE